MVCEGNGNAAGHVADHSVESEVAKMVERIGSSYGGLDILVNNAFAAFNDTAITGLDDQDGAASVISTDRRKSQSRSLTLISSLAKRRKPLRSWT